MDVNRFNRFAFFTIVLSIVIRIILPFYYSGTWLTTDSKNYILQSNDLIKGAFGLYFPNGYPAIIAALTYFFGIANRELLLIILNIILSTISIILFWFVIKKNIGVNIFSLMALVLFAFYPNQLTYVRFILTEVPALFFIILSFYFLSKENKISAAVSFGIAITIKTALLPVLLFWVIYLIYKKQFIAGLLYMFFASFPLLIMMIYGLFITGTFTMGYSSVHNFYITVDGSGLKSTNLIDGISYYFNFALSNPSKFLSDRLNSIWEFWGFLPSSNAGLRENLIFRLLIGIRFPLLLFAIYGFVKSKKDELIIFSAILIGSITLLHLIFYSIPRYNFVVEPFVIFLAILGLRDLFFRKYLTTESTD